MKSLACCYLWWPGMNKAIEKLVYSCETCYSYQTMPQKAPVYDWQRTNNPWVRLHINISGPFLWKRFLAIINFYLKWSGVIQIDNKK